MGEFKNLQNLLDCVGQEKVSIDTMLILTRPMSSMTLKQKEERATKIMELVDISQTEQELLTRARELQLI